MLRRVRFPPTKSNGEPWDAMRGAPDIVVVALLDDEEVLRAGPFDDRTEVELRAVVTRALPESGVFTFAAADKDLSRSDTAGYVNIAASDIPEDQSIFRIQTSAGVDMMLEWKDVAE